MAEDAAALESLGAILLWAGAFALASLAYYLAKAIVGAFDISIPIIGRPFHGLATTLENLIVSPLESVRKSAETGIAKGISGLVSSLQDILGLTLLLGYGTYQAIAYLWHTAIGALLDDALGPIRKQAQAAEAAAAAAAAKIASSVVALDNTIADVASSVAGDARVYANQVAAAAEQRAEAFAVQAVGRLETAEDAAVATAVSLAEDAKAAGIAAAHQAELDAEKFATAAKVDTLHAIADSSASLSNLINQVKAGAAAATTAAIAGVETEISKTTAGLNASIVAAAQEAASLAEAAKVAGLTAVAASAQTLSQAIEAAKVESLQAVAGSAQSLSKAIDAVERGAIASSAQVLSQAQAGINAAVTVAEQVATKARDDAEAFASTAIAAVAAADATAIDGVRSIAITAENEINDLVGPEGLIGAAALIASIPAIATLTNAIATEAGLENASCRSKVKGICGTDPLRWAGLLEGLAALGFAFSLEQLAEVAEPLVDELAGVLAAAA